MTITITHNNTGNDDVQEYESISGSFTVTTDVPDDPLVPDVFTHPTITSVTASLAGLTFTTNGTNSVSYSGAYNDVFERHWKYVMADNTKGDVPKVIQLPPSYLALYAFIPPAVDTLVVTLTFKGTTYSGTGHTPTTNVTLGTYNITVHYAWPADRAAFRAALEAGTLYQQALSKGLVG